jgi:hypothetical protein
LAARGEEKTPDYRHTIEERAKQDEDIKKQEIPRLKQDEEKLKMTEYD